MQHAELRIIESEMENNKPSLLIDSGILEQVLNFGALKYDPYKISKVLGLDAEKTIEFIKMFNDENSDIRIKYEQGSSISDYKIDAALMEKANKGNLDAILEISKRKYYGKSDSIKKEYFGL